MQEINFGLKERHDNMALINNKNFFSDNYVMDVFLFISAIISPLTTTLTISLLCKHNKLTTIIASPRFATSKRSMHSSTERYQF